MNGIDIFEKIARTLRVGSGIEGKIRRKEIAKILDADGEPNEILTLSTDDLRESKEEENISLISKLKKLGFSLKDKKK